MDNQELIKREDLVAMFSDKDSTITVLLVDRSGSMQGNEEAVLATVNKHLETIKNPPDGRDHYCLVITFADSYRIDVMLRHASKIDKMTDYAPKGSTLLWKTVYKTVKLFLNPFLKMTDEQKKHLQIFFGIFTDGEDTYSNTVDKDQPWPAKLLPATAEARAQGFEFLTFGFGRTFDVKTIARQMGLPDDDLHAIQFVACDPVSIKHAGEHFTNASTCFRGKNYDPGTNKP